MFKQDKMNQNHKEKKQINFTTVILTTLYDKNHHKQSEKDKP